MYDIVRMCAPIPPFFSADRYKPPFLIKKVYDTLWFGGWVSGVMDGTLRAGKWTAIGICIL